MIQDKFVITFSKDTAKRWIEAGIEVQKISDENKARKHGWYFLQTDVHEKFPDYKPRLKRQKHYKKKKQDNKPRPVSKKDKFYDEKKAKSNVIKWKRIPKELLN